MGLRSSKSMGLTNVGGNNGGGAGQGTGSSSGSNLAEEVVSSALRYRAQQPLVDSLLEQIGLRGGDMNGMTAPLVESLSGGAPAASKPQPTNGHAKG